MPASVSILCSFLISTNLSIAFTSLSNIGVLGGIDQFFKLGAVGFVPQRENLGFVLHAHKAVHLRCTSCLVEESSAQGVGLCVLASVQVVIQHIDELFHNQVPFFVGGWVDLPYINIIAHFCNLSRGLENNLQLIFNLNGFANSILKHEVSVLSPCRLGFCFLLSTEGY